MIITTRVKKQNIALLGKVSQYIRDRKVDRPSVTRSHSLLQTIGTDISSAQAATFVIHHDEGTSYEAEAVCNIARSLEHYIQ